MQDEDFIKAVMAGKEPMVTGRDGRKTVELFNAIYQSSREGKPVKWPLG
jgi:predicted dehydrogenase